MYTFWQLAVAKKNGFTQGRIDGFGGRVNVVSYGDPAAPVEFGLDESRDYRTAYSEGYRQGFDAVYQRLTKEGK